MDHEEIAKRHAENIMQRVNDTYPRTLNIGVLIDEIGKAIREATSKSDWANWPPPVFQVVSYLINNDTGDMEFDAKFRDLCRRVTDTHDEIAQPPPIKLAEAVTLSHDELRKKLSDRLTSDS